MLKLHSVTLLMPQTYSSSMSREGAKGLEVWEKRLNFEVSCKLPLEGSHQKRLNCYRVELQLIQSLMHQFRVPTSWLATPTIRNHIQSKNICSIVRLEASRNVVKVYTCLRHG